MVKKKILLSIVCLLVVIFIIENLGSADYSSNTDYQRHYAKSINNCKIDWDGCQEYPKLYHTLIGYLAHNEQTFFYSNLILFLLIFPTILWWFTKNFYTVFFFFTATNIPLTIFNTGAFASFFVFLIWIIFVYTKNPYARFILFGLGVLTHSYAFFLFSGTEILRAIFFNKNTFKNFPLIIPPGLTRFLENINGYIDYWTLSFFPLFSFLGFFYLAKKKNWFFLSIVIFSFIGSFINFRAFYPGVLILLISFSNYFIKTRFEFKLVFVITSLIYFYVLVSPILRGFGGFPFT